MSQKELNLGILAHVDAGKTTLTERLLYEAGAIGELGSVDAGTTQTDSLALEQQRGITIRSAVLSAGQAHVHTGAGIVAGSVPEREFEETEHKAAALRRAIELATGAGDASRPAGDDDPGAVSVAEPTVVARP